MRNSGQALVMLANVIFNVMLTLSNFALVEVCVVTNWGIFAFLHFHVHVDSGVHMYLHGYDLNLNVCE